MKKMLIVLLVLAANFSFAQPANDKEMIAAFNQLYGEPFPQLVLEDTSGTLFNTSKLKGKIIYVDFWFTACPPCLKQIEPAKALKKHFESDTSLVFLNICIENIDRKDAWKKMIQEKEIGGINLFYARNRPQKVNLLRQYKVNDFPTYMIVNGEHKIIGHNAPAPSEKYWVHWAITKAKENISLAQAYLQAKGVEFARFVQQVQQAEQQE